MEEKKNKKGLIWLIVILIILVLGLVGYIVYDKVLLKDKTPINNNSTNTTTTEKTNDNDIEDNILRRDNFIYQLNDENYTISYIYKVLTKKEYHENIFKDYDISLPEDYYTNYNPSIVYLEILLNNKKIENIKVPISFITEKISNNDLLNKINLLSSDTINIIKGIDSEYLVFTIPHNRPEFDGGTNPFIVNKLGKVIHTIKFDDGTGWWTTDEKSIMFDKGKYYINKDTLYYLLPNCEKTNGETEYFDQYSLKVENDKVVVEKQGTYKGTGVGGAICQD